MKFNNNVDFYRWVLIDNQVMCGYAHVVKLIDGYFQTKEQVYDYYPQYNPANNESMFMVLKIDCSAMPSNSMTDFLGKLSTDPLSPQRSYSKFNPKSIDL
jgi:hypothetical protein